MSDPTLEPVVEDHLSQLVGEGKKYATVEELAKGTIHANQFIDTLKAEKTELEEKLGVVHSQETHLETIVNLLKPTEEEPIIEPVTEPVIPVTEPISSAPTLELGPDLNRQQFAKLAVDKYGNAKEAGERLKQYINGDVSRQEMVMSMMQTDPSALVRILPDATEQRLMDGTSNTSMTTQTQTPQLPVTYTEAQKMFSEDRKQYSSAAYQSKINAAQIAARAAGIDFTKT